MEITITEATPTRFEVRTNKGYLALYTDRETAMAHANGLRVGYQAASTERGDCIGWRMVG